jgi:hypothetical protein
MAMPDAVPTEWGESDMKSDERAEKQPKDDQITRRKFIKYSLWGVVGVVVTALTAEKADAGYGACSVSGCYCQSYMGSGPLCQNCGHQYGMHW